VFGPDWLVAPVTAAGAASRSVYLPALQPNQTWVYYFNLSAVGQGGARVEVATPITEFPLFVIRELPPPPPVTANATFFYSALRNDTVVCVLQACYSANAPSQEGAYVPVGSVGQGVSAVGSDGRVQLGGRSYATAPLNLFFSFAWGDNFVSTNATPPDASYQVAFANGWVLSEPGPQGSAALSYWYKRFGPSSHDYATAAAGSAEEAWCVQRGYANVTAQFEPSWWAPAA
jgi:hypothetical protein